jgi:uncharacterized protein (TIGR02646 family)
MRTIEKRKEPLSLTEYRSSPGATYDGYQDKETLRSYLVTEQRGLCCYCLKRIYAAPGKMKIEHWHCQDRYDAEQLDYSNLLGACKGDEGKPLRDQHCDARKGNRDLSRNPANSLHRVEEMVRFGGDGRVSSEDPNFDSELNEVLNLNAAILVSNRKAVLEAFLRARAKRGNWSRTILEKWLRQCNGDSGTGQLEEYCQTVVYWLRKRLARS